jgi:phenylalanyl-tRNA synthetase beta chain
MKVSWSWLQDWVSLDGLDVDDVAARLTAAGLEVEAIERIGHGQDKIVVAKILSIEPHPKAERLSVCKVDVGEGALRQIVCGATNMEVGDLVPAALPGARPPGMDIEIAERELRGVLSQGMLCSSSELGQPKQAVDGLWILPEALTIGQPVFEALGLKDTVIHISVTPNRSDALSHRGVARDIAALYGRALRPLGAVFEAQAGDWSIKLTDAEGCPRYAFAVIHGAQVGESPAWLKARLGALGMRSISNAVDVTNYVMMDIGQPLHVFDLDKLTGGTQVEVRRAREGEKMVGIDHKEYILTVDDLVIADGERPIAMAGVMGGAQTEVGEQTERILLECAWFHPTLVRKGARRHGLHTESSHRFERCVDPGQTAAHLMYTLEVMARAMPGITIVQRGLSQAAQAVPVTITLPRGLTNRVLGTDWSEAQVRGALERLGLEVSEAGDQAWAVRVPTARPDLERPIDLVEEVARLEGLDAIPVTLPVAVMGGQHRVRPAREAGVDETLVSSAQRARITGMRGLLASQGVYEAYNYSFMSEAELELIGGDRAQAVELVNPMTVDHALMRTSLVPGLLRNLKGNLAQKITDVGLFEIGRRYFADKREPRTLGIALMGASAPHWQGRQVWDFYRAKGLIEALVSDVVGEPVWEVPSARVVYLHPGVQAALMWQGQVLAVLGKLHPALAQREGFGGQAVFLAELDLELLLAGDVRVRRYQPASRYPAVVRDYALLLDRAVSWGQVEGVLSGLKAGELKGVLEGWRLFDVYEGAQVPAGKRSLAVEVVLRSAQQTLTEEAVGQHSAQIVAALEARVGAQLRM